MTKIYLLLSFLLMSVVVMGQESSNGKDIGAGKEFLNKKMPNPVLTEWVSDKPNINGKFVLYEFWSTYCSPCKRIIPELNKISKLLKDNLVIIGIACRQNKEKVMQMREPKIEYYSATDPKGGNDSIFWLDGIPHSKLVSPKGIVIWEGNPLYPGEELTLDVIKRLIKKYK